MLLCVHKNRLFTLMTAFHALAWGLVLFVAGLFSTTSQKPSNSEKFLQNATNWFLMRQKVVELARAVKKAKIHVRGSKTSDYLTKALDELDFIMDTLEIDERTAYKRHVTESKNVCPEMYMGPEYDKPLFEKGFEETECNYSKPIQNLVTVVAIDHSTESDISRQEKGVKLVKSVLDVYGNISVILHTRWRTKYVEIFRDNPSVVLVQSDSDKSGSILNQLISKAVTPYVFIAKDLDFLTSDARFERLVREIERVDTAVAGGAWRDPMGHWTHGCYQTVFKNATLKFVYGYDESLHECLFCDHLTGPFIAKKDIFIKNGFRSYDFSDGLFEEWFLRLKFIKAEVISCPDAMFHTEEIKTQNNYKLFMEEFEIYYLIDTNGRTVFGNCSETTSRSRLKVLSPCVLNENSKLVKFVMSVCNDSGSICEVQDGTSLGAIKFGKVLPWEKDGDIGFHINNLTALSKLKTKFEKEQYRFQIDNSAIHFKGPKIKLYVSIWRIELFGLGLLSCEMSLAQGMNTTKVFLDGQWVNVPRNPGLVARNRYGQEVYQHALHWIDTEAKSEWDAYKPAPFLSCGPYKQDLKESHDCLDRYNADGSLQFDYVLP